MALFAVRTVYRLSADSLCSIPNFRVAGDYGEGAVSPRPAHLIQSAQPPGIQRISVQGGQQLVAAEAAGGARRQQDQVVHPVAFMAMSTFSGVMGSSRCHTPVAR